MFVRACFFFYDFFAFVRLHRMKRLFIFVSDYSGRLSIAMFRKGSLVINGDDWI